MSTLLTPQKLENLRILTKKALCCSSGDMAEVGVYRGGSARAMLQEMDALQQHRTMHLFDTFEGLPGPGGPLDAPGLCREGLFSVELPVVRELLSPWWERTIFHVGTFPETTSGLEETLFSVVHVDVDLEESVRACCEWFAPRMSRGGVMVFDDYDSPDWRGVKPVVDACFERLLFYYVVQLPGCCQAMVRF